jgi:hypothetical protein
MEQSIISAVAGLTGSLLGGMSTFAASWLTTHRQHRTQTFIQQAARREQLYAEFIREGSRHLVNAWGHEMGSPENLADIYSTLERIRLMSTPNVVSAAESVMQQVVAAYTAPNKTYDELQNLVMDGSIVSPLTKFSNACRAEFIARGI